MVTVRGCCHSGLVIAKVLRRKEFRTVRQDNVVLGEAFLDQGWGRYDYYQAGTEAQGENVAVLLRKTLERTVEGFFNEMQMTQYWQRRWTGREALGWSLCLKIELEGKEQEKK